MKIARALPVGTTRYTLYTFAFSTHFPSDRVTCLSFYSVMQSSNNNPTLVRRPGIINNRSVNMLKQQRQAPPSVPSTSSAGATASSKSGTTSPVITPPDNNNTKPNSNDFKTKTVLKEAVDAVVSSFAKHSHGYGRGKKSRTWAEK